MGKYGIYISENKTSIMVRVPNCIQESFPIKNADKAMLRRDELCKMHGLDLLEYRKTRKHTKSHSDKKKPLPVRVSMACHIKPLADGTEVMRKCIQASGNRKIGINSRSWSVDKYGYDVAVKKASEWQKAVDNQEAGKIYDTDTVNKSLPPKVKLRSKSTGTSTAGNMIVQIFEVTGHAKINGSKKTWSVNKFSFDVAKKLAIDWQTGINKTIELSKTSGIISKKDIAIIEASLPAKLSFVEAFKDNANGGVTVYQTILALGDEGKKINSRSWSINKYGIIGAINLANEWQNALHKDNKSL